MDEKISEHKDLIQDIEAMPEVPTPDHLTERAMSHLPELDQGAWAKMKHTLFNPSWDSIQSLWAQILSVSNRRECSFCFFITGYCYLIMGITLMLGFKAIGPSMDAMELLKLQPHLTIGTAIWLFALGIVLMMKRSIAIKIAKYGTWVYIFFTGINGILMWDYLLLPYVGVPLILFWALSTFAGFFLAYTVQKVELMPIL